jgi:hypothetical protein
VQRPTRDEAASGPVPYGTGPRSDPHEGAGARREAPFGPEISWPHGFRQLDPQSREVLESAYVTGPTYQPPTMDDYGDPGYSDPSYDGPRTSYAGPGIPGAPVFPGAADYRQPDARVPGYHVPEVRDSRPGFGSPGYPGSGQPGYSQAGPGQSGPGQASGGYPGAGYQSRDFRAPSSGGGDIYPVTGAQEVLRDTAPQPAYPEPWYDNPRLTDRGRDGQDLSGQRSPDPRLEGMRYDELRYEEEPVSAGQVSASPGFDDSVEDESWYAELRRNGPAFPADFREEPRSSGPVRHAEPQGPSFGSQPGYSQPPAPGRFLGYGQSRDDRRPDPQPNAGRGTGPGPRTGPAAEPGSGPWTGGPDAAARPQGSAIRPATARGTPFLSAPAVPVGLLTPPAGHRIEALRDNDPAMTSLDIDTSQFRNLPGTGRQGSTAVRPGHGLDGPEITSSWPIQVPAEDADRFAEFWQEDDEEVDYKGLFGDRVAEPDGTKASKRRIGRRRSGSNDHRLWLSLGGVVIVAAAAITGIVKFEFPSHSGPAHTMVTPAKIGTYARTVDLERQTNVAQLRDDVIKMSSGQANHVVTAVYESGNAAGGNTEQIIMFIGGHLANAAPATSVSSFMQKFAGAHVVNAGSLGGKAACVEEGGGTSDSVSMCAWFDNDSFGEIVSPTMNATNLAAAMTTVRPAVEQVAKK